MALDEGQLNKTGTFSLEKSPLQTLNRKLSGNQKWSEQFKKEAS